MMEVVMKTGSTMVGHGSPDSLLTEEEIRRIVMEAFQTWDTKGQKILVIIPDTTRTMRMPLFFKLFSEALSGKVKALDYLIALGTHQPLSTEAINQHLGISAEERKEKYGWINIYNHQWNLKETFTQVGILSSEETRQLSHGMLTLDVPVVVNKMVMDYDLIIVCGPVFPHEVVGFSGGNKYFFPGISGSEVTNFTHWLAALVTNFKTIGIKQTAVRAIINKVAGLIKTPKLFFCPVVKKEGVVGLFVGDHDTAWSAAADLSAQVHIKYMDKPFRQVLAVMPHLYDDIWTAGKGMYKSEPVIADGGEVTIFAPHISEVSFTHGEILDAIGYHVRDYYVKQWDRFKTFPWGVVAHSTHVKGMGTYENGIEHPRVDVNLATAIPAARCRKINLGYRDPSTIHIEEFMNRESDGILFIPYAGEILYRLKSVIKG
jgi:lactate racemase